MKKGKRKSKKKKNNSFSFMIIGIIAIIGLGAFFYLNGNTEVPEPTKTENIASIFYLDKTNNRLEAEETTITGETKEEQITNALNQMKTSSKNEGLFSAIPETLEVLSVELVGTTAKIDLSSDYITLKAGDEIYARGAIVWTVTSFDAIDKVEIFVNGKSLKKTNGEAYGPLGRDDVIINSEIEAEPTIENKTITLYFTDDNLMGFTKEEREVEISPNHPIEYYVLEELVKGPKEEGNISVIPSETKIRNIQTQDGICYVDLSQDFITKNTGGSTEDYYTIYTIVNSLTELDNIDKVQFLIEGEKQDEFKGSIEFDKLFEPINVD